MMKLKIEIEMDNAAFEAPGDNSRRFRDGAEPARMLFELAHEMKSNTLETGDTWTLSDINDNACGKAKVTR
jgi:hypothetical protein